MLDMFVDHILSGHFSQSSLVRVWRILEELLDWMPATAEKVLDAFLIPTPFLEFPESRELKADLDATDDRMVTQGSATSGYLMDKRDLWDFIADSGAPNEHHARVRRKLAQLEHGGRAGSGAGGAADSAPQELGGGNENGGAIVTGGHGLITSGRRFTNGYGAGSGVGDPGGNANGRGPGAAPSRLLTRGATFLSDLKETLGLGKLWENVSAAKDKVRPRDQQGNKGDHGPPVAKTKTSAGARPSPSSGGLTKRGGQKLMPVAPHVVAIPELVGRFSEFVVEKRRLLVNAFWWTTTSPCELAFLVKNTIILSCI